MRALLDTSSFLWFIANSDKLSLDARNFIVNLDNELVLSVSSLWEIAVKASIGKIELLQPFSQLIPEQLNINEIDTLPIELRSAHPSIAGFSKNFGRLSRSVTRHGKG
jgi:PIN domain nuclease of toxin-antitoxin system